MHRDPATVYNSFPSNIIVTQMTKKTANVVFNLLSYWIKGKVSKTIEGGSTMSQRGRGGNSFYIAGGKVVMSYTVGAV